jgi:hypothetical protein
METTNMMRLVRSLSVRLTRDEIVVGALLLVQNGCFARNPAGLFHEGPLLYAHLGAEYYNIALALVDGRGYADPFAELSGPTAWMPPLYPALLALLTVVLRDRALVAHAVVVLTVFALSAVGIMLFRMAKRSAVFVPAWVIVVGYVLWLWAFYSWFFFLTHDIWLHTLLIACLVALVHRYSLDGVVDRWRWGLLGGVSSLTSPAITFAWLTFSAVTWLRSRAHRKVLLVSVAIACCMAAPWIVRNAWTFQRVIPTKSNLMYEAYQANYRYPNGIYDGTWEEHPNESSIARFRYARVGEMAFIDDYARNFWLALKADPGRYLRNVYERALAVTLVHPDQGTFDPPLKMQLRRLVYPVPFLALVVGILAGGRHRRFLIAVAVPWVAYLVPYVLVAFYLRYLLPLTAALMLVSFLCSDQLVQAASHWLAVKRGRASETSVSRLRDSRPP